jgi:hypothetical protein
MMAKYKAALWIAAEEAYQHEIVDTEMANLMEDSRAEWIEDKVQEWLTGADNA